MLGDARPWGLWVRGQTELRYACLRSVSVVGTRAATGYGLHVGGELAASLAEKGRTIVSGGTQEVADTQQARTHSYAQRCTACLRVRQPAYGMHVITPNR